MKSLTFTVNLPPSVNGLYIRGRILSPAGKAFKSEAGWIARMACQDAGWEMVTQGKLALTVNLYMKKGDGDNRLKALQDALTGIVWKDDSMVKAGHWFVHYSKREYAEITIEVIE